MYSDHLFLSFPSLMLILKFLDAGLSVVLSICSTRNFWYQQYKKTLLKREWEMVYGLFMFCTLAGKFSLIFLFSKM